MADTKVSDLTAIVPVLTDVMYVVDDPGGTPASNKCTLQALLTLFNANATIAESQISDLQTYQVQLSEGAFADGDKTKLDAIEASADVTDATNVAAAGAIMDGDFSTNGLMKRTGAGVYAAAVADTDFQSVPSEGAFANGDKTKLDGIAAGAEVNTIESVPAATGADQVVNVESLTQAEYTAATKVSTTLYLITDAT